MNNPTNEFDDDAGPRPCAGGLLAGTLALMTCWAAPATEPETSHGLDAQQQRSLIARKVVSNLFFLRSHPDIGPGLQQVVAKVHQRWVLIAREAAAEAPATAATATDLPHVAAATSHLH